MPWDKVTVINHAFFEVDSSFKLATTDSYADFDKSFPHSEGWDADKLRGHMGEYKYYKSQYPNVKVLTIAAPSGYDKAQYTEPNVYAQYLDFINVMTYDMHGAWETTTNHHAAIYPNPNDPSGTSPIDIKNKYNTDSAMKLYRDTYNIPASKLNVGTPFYSRGWKNVVNNGGNLPGLFASANGAPVGTWDNAQSPGGQNPYFKMKELEKTSGYVKYRDPYAKVPYLYNASQGIMYTYEDEESLTERCNYVLNNGYGGMIAWEVSGDDPNGFPLTSLMANKLAGGSNPTTPSNPTNPSNPTTPTNPTDPATPSNPGTSYPAWDSSKAYVNGDIVSYNNNNYKAKWWTQGDKPGASDVWELIGATTPNNPKY